MTDRYDSATAEHYAAYRPPVHKLILSRVIDSHESFHSGLDVGCGTGYSSIALARYCERVHGVDSSEQMLSFSEANPNVIYALGNVVSLEKQPCGPYDIVTFAGSLFYVKSKALKIALLNICKSSAAIIVYDFYVLMEKLLEFVGIEIPFANSVYDHNSGLSEWDEIETIMDESDQIRLEASPKEVAHLLLSDTSRHKLLECELKAADPMEILVNRMGREKTMINLQVDIWYKRYKLALEH